MPRMTSVTIQFPSDVLKNLKKFAGANGVSLAFVVRSIVENSNNKKSKLLLTRSGTAVQ